MAGLINALNFPVYRRTGQHAYRRSAFQEETASAQVTVRNRLLRPQRLPAPVVNKHGSFRVIYAALAGDG